MFITSPSDNFLQVKKMTNDEAAQFRIEPLLITDIMKSWKAFPKWSIKYLKDNYGHYRISADRKENGTTKYIYPILSDFIGYINKSKSINPYYAKTALHLCTSMKDEYSAPPLFNCWYRKYYDQLKEERKINLSNFYIGPTNARCGLHVDIWATSFWNALFQGKKLWIFIAKDSDHLIYKGQIDPFYPNFKKYPEFAKVKAWVCIQSPGEIIYCPSNIWHATMALEPSIALSENFINADNYQNVLKHFQTIGYSNAYKKLNEIVKLNLSTY